MIEQWLTLREYTGLYEISDWGRVWSYKSERLLHWARASHGYAQVSLRDWHGNQRHWRVHRLVMRTFVGPCPRRMEVCHNDGDKLNNFIKNLRYDTHQDNVHEAIRAKGLTPLAEWHDYTWRKPII